MSQKIFHICTLVNNLNLYKSMKDSFMSAGFSTDLCRYTVFDNSQSNQYDPYNTFNYIRSITCEPYIIFCHQDILIDQGVGFDDLLSRVNHINELDSSWAVLGNAGVDYNYKLIAKISDPNSTPVWNGSFPHKVHSLDENFLIINTSKSFFASSDLKGFHFYATDICLNAILKGYSCYVIDFHVTHLSGGSLNQYFWDVKERFHDVWNSKIHFGYVKTTTGVLVFLSKYLILRSIFSSQKFINWFFVNPIGKKIQKLIIHPPS